MIQRIRQSTDVDAIPQKFEHISAAKIFHIEMRFLAPSFNDNHFSTAHIDYETKIFNSRKICYYMLHTAYIGRIYIGDDQYTGKFIWKN